MLEQRLDRLERIVAELENEQIDLASALALFEEGVTCLRDAAGTLAEAETRVKRLVELLHSVRFPHEDKDSVWRRKEF